MQPGAVLRVARPTDHLTAIAEMYATGLGFSILAEFHDHDGFDGIILQIGDGRYDVSFGPGLRLGHTQPCEQGDNKK